MPCIRTARQRKSRSGCIPAPPPRRTRSPLVWVGGYVVWMDGNEWASFLLPLSDAPGPAGKSGALAISPASTKIPLPTVPPMPMASKSYRLKRRSSFSSSSSPTTTDMGFRRNGLWKAHRPPGGMASPSSSRLLEPRALLELRRLKFRGCSAADEERARCLEPSKLPAVPGAAAWGGAGVTCMLCEARPLGCMYSSLLRSTRSCARARLVSRLVLCRADQKGAVALGVWLVGGVGGLGWVGWQLNS